jgi:Tfp pilus assembly protein PilF
LPEALAEALIAVEQAPEHAQALGHLAHIKQMMGDLEEAEERLRLAMELEPHNDHLRQQYNMLMERKEKRSAA